LGAATAPNLVVNDSSILTPNPLIKSGISSDLAKCCFGGLMLWVGVSFEVKNRANPLRCGSSRKRRTVCPLTNISRTYPPGGNSAGMVLWTPEPWASRGRSVRIVAVFRSFLSAYAPASTVLGGWLGHHVGLCLPYRNTSSEPGGTVSVLCLPGIRGQNASEHPPEYSEGPEDQQYVPSIPSTSCSPLESVLSGGSGKLASAVGELVSLKTVVSSVGLAVGSYCVLSESAPSPLSAAHPDSRTTSTSVKRVFIHHTFLSY